jgi:protoheme IX farnesyltransferase
MPVITGLFGAFYLVSALLLGSGFILGAARLLRDESRKAALQLYLGSLAYLFVLFAAMAADRLLAV